MAFSCETHPGNIDRFASPMAAHQEPALHAQAQAQAQAQANANCTAVAKLKPTSTTTTSKPTTTPTSVATSPSSSTINGASPPAQPSFGNDSITSNSSSSSAMNGFAPHSRSSAPSSPLVTASSTTTPPPIDSCGTWEQDEAEAEADEGEGEGEGENKLRAECLAMEEKVASFLREEDLSPSLKGVQEQVKITMGVIRRALETYDLDALSLSYNGGKDCLVLLILVLATLPSVYRSQDNFPKSLQSVYVVSKHPFAEVDSFVDATAREYSLDLRRYGMGMKQALRAYLDERPNVKAVFVGTRRTDPHGARLTHFDPTDDGWPAFMRVHPVIDWHYVEIWGFIRHLRIPYCPLYDQGYTSLGGTTDTHPNPALRLTDNNVSEAASFRPAYELYEDDAERLGRDN